MTSPTPPPDRPPPPWEPRFSLAGMFLIMFVLSCVFAGGYYALRAVQGGTGSKLVLILAILAGPMLIMMLVSLFHGALRRCNRRRPRPKSSDR